MNKVDIAIIGSGPAGISAAINAKIRNKSFLLFGSGDFSRKVELSPKIENYPAFEPISGKELNGKFKKQLDEMEISVTDERITGIYNMGDYFVLLAGQKEYSADAVIIATGSETSKTIPGEREFLGRGVSYCATCDGNLYRGKTIAVICESEDMEEEVVYLSELAENVHYFPTFKSGIDRENITVHNEKIVSVNGGLKVQSVTLKSGEEINVCGVFFLKNSVSADILLNGLKTENGHIIVGRNMETNIKGCFAAGDCTGTPYQIAKAIGEGNVALHSAISYLAKK